MRAHLAYQSKLGAAPRKDLSYVETAHEALKVEWRDVCERGVQPRRCPEVGGKVPSTPAASAKIRSPRCSGSPEARPETTKSLRFRVRPFMTFHSRTSRRSQVKHGMSSCFYRDTSQLRQRTKPEERRHSIDIKGKT